jgi:hypothetical protein
MFGMHLAVHRHSMISLQDLLCKCRKVPLLINHLMQIRLYCSYQRDSANTHSRSPQVQKLTGKNCQRISYHLTSFSNTPHVMRHSSEASLRYQFQRLASLKGQAVARDANFDGDANPAADVEASIRVRGEGEFVLRHVGFLVEIHG